MNGTEIQVGDETGILQQALYCTPEITLNADQSMFSIEFATSNYVAANKDDIIYKLEGFSNDWNSARGLHNITYTNLNAGTYNLIIKPNGKDESLCPQVHLTIHVLPPYYKTPLAYLIYLIVTGILLWYLVRTYKSRIKLRESLKYEQKHIRDVEALNQSKLRFFTNISHEFRTPLTLIVAQVETGTHHRAARLPQAGTRAHEDKGKSTQHRELPIRKLSAFPGICQRQTNQPLLREGNRQPRSMV